MGLKVTLSGGVKQYEKESIDNLIEMADKTLYDAKRFGRNRITVFERAKTD
jgi:PleD family two-component response regulator